MNMSQKLKKMAYITHIFSYNNLDLCVNYLHFYFAMKYCIAFNVICGHKQAIISRKRCRMQTRHRGYK